MRVAIIFAVLISITAVGFSAVYLIGKIAIVLAGAGIVAYVFGLAFLNPIRKIYYNLTVTVISVLVAWAIGTIELLQVLSSELNWGGWFWSGLNALNFEMIEFAIIGIFVVSWLLSFGYWRYKKYDQIAPFSEPQQPSINPTAA